MGAVSDIKKLMSIIKNHLCLKNSISNGSDEEDDTMSYFEKLEEKIK